MRAPLGQARQVLADLNPRRARGSRIEIPPHFRRRTWLEIEALVLREAAGQKDVDAGFGLGPPPISSRPGGAQRLQMIDPQAEQTDRAGLNRRSA